MKRAIFILALLISFPALCQKWKPVYAPFDSLMIAADRTKNEPSRTEALAPLVEKMNKMAARQGDKRLKWRALFWASVLDLGRSDLGSASDKVQKALAMVDSTKYEYDYRRMLWQKVMTSDEGVNNSIIHYREAQRGLKYFKSVDDKPMVALMNVNLGQVYLKMNMPEKARNYFEEGCRQYREIGYDLSAKNVERTLMRMYVNLGDSLTAKRIYREATEDAGLRNDTTWLMITYGNAFDTGIDPEGAKKAYALAVKYGDRDALRFSTTYMGWDHFMRGEFKEAIAYFKKAQGMDAPLSVNKNAVNLSILDGISSSYHHLQWWDSAHIYALQYFQMRDSLQTINSNADFQELYEKLALEREEEHIAQEQRNARNRLVTMVLVFSLLIIVALGALYYSHIKRRLKEAENKELASRVETERLQKELYKEQTENRERELTTNSLLLIEKKKMIDHLNKRIEQQTEEGMMEDRARRELQNFIRMHQGTEESMTQFYDYFSQEHPDFFTTLKQRYPALTKGDLRLCAYIRIGLDNKQIAQTLSVQPHAVKMARYRLRQKFGLETKDSLSDFLLLIKERESE